MTCICSPYSRPLDCCWEPLNPASEVGVCTSFPGRGGQFGPHRSRTAPSPGAPRLEYRPAKCNSSGEHESCGRAVFREHSGYGVKLERAYHMELEGEQVVFNFSIKGPLCKTKALRYQVACRRSFSRAFIQFFFSLLFLLRSFCFFAFLSHLFFNFQKISRQ